MHILFFFFVTLPLVLLAFKIWFELPIEMLSDGNVAGALLWIAIFWGVPLLIFAGATHR
ncbi:hypothetical protein [Pinisolibacter sp.]|uniref:hypothetical protein n=1 Tax=Pinisolibacter sp. TaxID=2172024 RepID=UPI002FDDFD93